MVISWKKLSIIKYYLIERKSFLNYKIDMEMFCGGKSTQWNQNGGKCSICGEDYSKPKRFEKGGDMYRGLIVKTYKNTDNIDITLDVILYIHFFLFN